MISEPEEPRSFTAIWLSLLAFFIEISLEFSNSISLFSKGEIVRFFGEDFQWIVDYYVHQGLVKNSLIFFISLAIHSFLKVKYLRIVSLAPLCLNILQMAYGNYLLAQDPVEIELIKVNSVISSTLVWGFYFTSGYMIFNAHRNSVISFVRYYGITVMILFSYAVLKSWVVYFIKDDLFVNYAEFDLFRERSSFFMSRIFLSSSFMVIIYMILKRKYSFKY